MTLVIWLIVWLIEDSPGVSFSPMNGWAIALLVCAAIEILWRGR